MSLCQFDAIDCDWTSNDALSHLILSLIIMSMKLVLSPSPLLQKLHFFSRLSSCAVHISRNKLKP
ncbi:Uncharacterized protein APZ42_028380 [Daphnia magna]|uniref:Uncharacterized protein n=1 Tax=Daphnia magna TaxID=35525 RepID=A0A164QRE2_9CRUS|nr:Uncharacterized protein APZ42_028380 [Daphnia magna]